MTLGGHFASRAVIVDYRIDDEVIVRLARVIPEREVWLYKNPKALASVRRGLDQARKGTCRTAASPALTSGTMAEWVRHVAISADLRMVA